MKNIHKAIVSILFGIVISLPPLMSKATDPLPVYELQVSIKPESGLLEVDLVLEVPIALLQNNTLSFLASSNINLIKLSGNHLSSYHQSEAGPEMSLYTLEFKGTPDHHISINMDYTIVIPSDHQVNRITAGWIELNIDAFWHPVLISFPRFHYKLTTDLDKSYHILSGDYVKTIRENPDLRTIESIAPRFDISFTASKQFFSKEGDYSLVHSTNPSTNLDSLLNLSEQALAFLESYINKPNDFKKKRIVIESPRKDVGYARENYVVLSKLDDMDAVHLSSFLTHEFAHYWFSMTNPQTQDYWLDESFAEFLSMIFIREIYGNAVYLANLDDKLLKIQSDPRPFDSFQGRPSHAAMYYLGPVVLHHFESYLGRKQFQNLIRQMIEERISRTEDLLLLIKKLFGSKAEEKLIELRSQTFKL